MKRISVLASAILMACTLINAPAVADTGPTLSVNPALTSAYMVLDDSRTMTMNAATPTTRPSLPAMSSGLRLRVFPQAPAREIVCLFHAPVGPGVVGREGPGVLVVDWSTRWTVAVV